MKRLIGVYGASGCGRGIMPLLRAAHQHDPETQLVFVDDGVEAALVNGHRVMDWQQFLAFEADQRMISIAIANSRVRETLATRCRENGVGLIEARAAA